MSFARFVGSVAILAFATTAVPAVGSMRILTYPTGLVVGELEVRVDLGPEGQPAELYLDGERECTVSAEHATCTVDLGADPHVHLLELVRESGERTERWVNRPGQEAELEVVPLPPTGSRQCEARIGWTHPERLDPVELEVTLAGSQPEIAAGGRLVRFPCPEPGQSQILVALAVFPDGRRVESVAVTGGFAEQTLVALHAVPLVSDAKIAAPCESTAAGWSEAAERVEKSGFEVVIVLDPGAAYLALRASGWDRGRLENTSASTKVFDQAVRSGGKSSEPKPRNSWLKSKASLFDADRLWYVAPDQGLHRVNGFGAGRPNWLKLLFKFGLADVPGQPRIADAVAASGLVAAAGPRRRAVVLILGNNVHKRDGSRFSPRQAREYLAEVNVPLVVLRNGKRREDGWPAGLPALNMEAMSRSLARVRELLDAQCIAWFSEKWNPSRLADTLPPGVRLAGSSEDAPVSSESVWARAELELAETAEVPDIAGLAIERLDITAMTVVVSALDANGRPVLDLSAEDFEVLEDGKPVTVLELASVAPVAQLAPIEITEANAEAAVPASPQTDAVTPDTPIADAKALPVTVYVNRTIGGGFDQRQALRAVKGELGRLAALGPVEVVVAEKQEVRSVVGPTRDLHELSTAFDEVAARKTAVHAIERIRRRFVNEVRQIPDRMTLTEIEAQNEQDDPAQIPSSRVTLAARVAAGEEHVIISRALNQLRLWAQRETGQRAGLLVVVGAGFDEDPAAFYAPVVGRLEPHNVSQLREDLRSKRKEASVNALGRELASTGWRVVTVAGQTTGSASFAAELRTDKFFSFLTASTDAIHTVETDFLLVNPIDAQRNLAEPSGGDVVIGPAGLAKALDASSGWYLLTYQVARSPDGAAHTLELEARRPGIELKTTEIVTSATSEGQAEARARRLLGGSMEKGDLEVDLTLGSTVPAADEGKKLSAEVEVTVHFRSLAPLVRPGALLRVSVAVVAAGAEPTVVHRSERLEEAAAGWIYAFPVEWPAQASSRLAVTVEELASGLWGGAQVALPTR
ncbi:MAG: hypothetical protein IH936_01520 [Acidobacteria bacterium]|nr:hypothetical protein [Acidobacteriota bacterium]